MTTLFTKIQSKKAMLWDFDGCFCNSEYIHFLSYAKAFAEYGHTVNKDEYFETFTHTGAGAAYEIEKYKLNCRAEDIRNLKEKYYWELIENKQAQLFPEIPKIISCLKKMGIKNVIASNSKTLEINLILSQAEPIDLDGIIGFEPGIRKKPFPDIYNKALSMLAINPEEALVMEDSERGLIAACAAGCEAIWVNTPITERFESRAPYIAKISHREFLNTLEQGV